MNGWTRWFGDEVKRLTNEACCKAVQKTGEVVLAAAKNEVPLDEGTLKDSGIVIMAAGNEPACCITFGGGQGTGFPIVPYAIRWHEHTANFQHGRKAFYLRDPFNRLAKQKLEEFIKEEMRNFL
jgi:hypothetical protein